MEYNIKQLAEGILICISNAERLLSCAQKIESSDSGVSFGLLCHSAEEMGKIIMLCNFDRYKGRRGVWVKKFLSHSEKQKYSKILDDPTRIDLELNNLEKDKENIRLESLYTRLTKDGVKSPINLKISTVRKYRKTLEDRLEKIKKSHPDQKSAELFLERIHHVTPEDQKKLLSIYKELVRKGKVQL